MALCLSPRVASGVVRANPGQALVRLGWRWGRAWQLPNGRRGLWARSTLTSVAVRVEHVEDEPIVDPVTFIERLDRARRAADREAWARSGVSLRASIS